jgi:hypothetical protein
MGDGRVSRVRLGGALDRVLLPIGRFLDFVSTLSRLFLPKSSF